MIRMAIQKSGRLYDDCIELLKACGIKLDGSKNKLREVASNFPLDILYLRNSDIPEYVEDGTVDIGIVGDNLLHEVDKDVVSTMKLGFSKCRLSLAVPKTIDYSGLDYFNGKNIATSYPHSLEKFLKSKSIQAEIHEISGSVEVAPSIGLAEGICDLVSSGNTLFMNGLKEVEVLLHSEAVLIASPNLSPEKQAIYEQLIFRIEATQRAQQNKYVVLNVPNDKISAIAQVLSGIKSPTVVPLAQEGWSALHSVIPDKDFWSSIDELKRMGAEGILVMPIEKMVL